MKLQIAHGTLELVQGDITEQDTDAIVNAANSRLAGGGGVDGAIHRKGGPSIMEETQRRYPAGCATGDAVITSGGRLRARHVIHAVGPVYDDGKRGEPEKLASAYRRSIQVAAAAGCKSIAFPSLSTGAYRYPVNEAAPIALGAVADELRLHPQIELVRFVLFDQKTYEAYARAGEQLRVES